MLPRDGDTYAVVAPTGAVLDRHSWEWADIDPERDRVVFTQDCVLHGARLGADELGAPVLLFDTRPLRFEEREAPY